MARRTSAPNVVLEMARPGLPVGENRADVGLLQEVPFDASDEEVLARHDRRVTRAHVEHAEIGPADLAGQLQPEIDRHLFSGKQPDLAAEKRDHFRLWPGRGMACP